MGTPLGPKYVQYNYLDPLGLEAAADHVSPHDELVSGM